MTKYEVAKAFIQRIAEYQDYTHDDVDELAILETIQHEAHQILTWLEAQEELKLA